MGGSISRNVKTPAAEGSTHCFGLASHVEVFTLDPLDRGRADGRATALPPKEGGLSCRMFWTPFLSDSIIRSDFSFFRTSDRI